MARKEAEAFDGVEPELLYVARKLRHATRVEALLDDAGIDYVVETDTFASGFIFRTERVGAFFYVLPEDQPRATMILEREGFRLHVGQARG
jgi:hypothetical protein